MMIRLLCAAAVLAGAAAAAPTCEALAALTIPNTTIESAVTGAPPYCRVTAVAKPVPDSEIRIEVWLPPAERWNGKFLGTGNGGYSGALSYQAMEHALKQGYATAGSDTGHPGADLKFGLGHPEKINDWGYRAVHVMTETARLIVRAYYGRFAAHSYFAGCSTGGQQGLSEAQRFPADYDGIVAGDPGYNRVRLNVGFLWSWAAAGAVPASKLPVVYRAAIDACDAIDGIKDVVIDDPRRCRFDPGALLCQGPDGAGCLTAGEVAAVRKVYDGARNPRTGERIYPGWARGSEAPAAGPIGSWAGYFVGRAEPARVEFWRYWVFDDPAWDPRSFDFDRDVSYAEAKLAAVSAVDPDLGAFQRRGGKLIMYHGWADPVAPPEDAVGYYERVAGAMGGLEKTAGFFRLFMAPGMAHCGGGPGPNTFDALGALDLWVAKGVAPNRILASHSNAGKVDRTRPLCPYPQAARWTGSGSTDDATAFVCAAQTEQEERGLKPAPSR
jgi:feruloyl esterase